MTIETQIDTPDTHTYIYGLIDPRTNEIRYVGKANSPIDRLKRHLRDKSPCHRTSWLKGLTQLERSPILIVIQRVAKDNWQFAEQWWIARFREAGTDLVNGTDGGDGGLGHKASEETRQKMSLALRGRIVSDETRKRMCAAQKGKTFSDETRHKMSLTQKGKTISAETRLKISEAMKGIVFTDEHCSNLSRAGMGHKSSDAIKQRISEANKGNSYWLGRKHSEEAKIKISRAKKGNKNMLGHKHSEESKLKMSISRKAANAQKRQEINQGQRGGESSCQTTGT